MAEDNANMPSYRIRSEIESLASSLVHHEEPAVSAEDCGTSPEDMRERLVQLQQKVEDALDETQS